MTLSQTVLVAMMKKETVDVSAHIEQATDLSLYGIGLLFLFFIIRPELWRRLFFTRVDPRPGALMRIGFGLVVFITFYDLLWPMNPLEFSVAKFLFTDEGLWMTDMARQNYGGQLRELYDPQHGFEHWYDPLKAMWGKFTFLHLRSDPPFSMTLYIVMLGCVVSMIFGFRTRLVTIVAFILVESFYRYSPIFYTGGDTVVRVFLFLGMFSRWGEAYSVDSWLRRRKAVLAGGASRVPPLRTVPAWPFRLMMLQLCIIYCATGILKSGSTWKDGTALFYALNLDHFYRYPMTGVVTAAHWSLILPNTAIFVRWWEVLFPLVGIGAALNAYERERASGEWPKAALWRKLLSLGVFLAAWAMMAWVLGVAGVYFLPPEVQSHVHPAQRQALYSGVVMAVPVVSIALYWVLRLFAPKVLTFIRHWVLGKRFWLFFGLLLHIGIDLGMNVGTFAEVMMTVYLCWLSGKEIESFWLFVYQRRCAPGEGDRPARSPRWKAFLFAPYDWFHFRKSGPRYVVRHNPSEASVRRATLVRMLDLGKRVDFVEDDAVPAETLCVEHQGARLTGNAAAAALTRVLPVLLWLRPVRKLPGVGAVARVLMSQRA
ncbi:MAG: HTTM domain-containing protein [Nannocystaceae bacterium]|nr:HTTM domain-containing protein [bacterium]